MRTQGQADVPVLIAPKCSECFVVVVTEGSEDDKGGGRLLSPASPRPCGLQGHHDTGSLMAPGALLREGGAGWAGMGHSILEEP